MLCWTVHLKGVPNEGGRQPVAVAVRHEVYEFGSSTTLDQMPVNVFNTVTLLWTKLPPETDCKGKRPRWVPSWRAGHTAVLIEDTVYICGGATDWGNICGSNLYAFDVRAPHRWSKPTVSGTVPEGRRDGAACALGRVMYLHGGMIWNCNYANFHNDYHKLDTRTMVWSAIVPARGQPAPPRSAYHSANVIGTKVFVFGGEGEEEESFYNHVRVFDTTTSRWLKQPSMSQHSLGSRRFRAVFAWHGELYVYVFRSKKCFRQLRKFSPETFSWKNVRCGGKGPSDNWMCSCMVGDCVVLFGGYQGYQGFNAACADLHILDLSPSLKTLCKLAVIQHGLEQSEIPHNIRWELQRESVR